MTQNFIISGFRAVHEGELNAQYRHMAWCLAAIVSSQTPLPVEVRSAWPDILKVVLFIAAMMDATESLPDMLTRVEAELQKNPR